MQKKLTIKVNRTVNKDLVKPHVIHPNLDAAYAAMAKDKAREKQALEWAENVIGT